MHAAETRQPTPHNDTWPLVAPYPDHTGMRMPAASYPQQQYNLGWSQRYHQAEGEVGGGYPASTQETFSYNPNAPSHDSNNPGVAGTVDWQSIMNMQQLESFLTDADQTTPLSPYFNSNPRASNTHPRVSNLGPHVPPRSVNQPFSPGQDFVVDFPAANSPALPSRVAPQQPIFPPAGQERDRIVGGRRAADIASDIAFVGAGLGNPLLGQAMHHGGQGRLGVGAQHVGAQHIGAQNVGANTNQTDLHQCLTCGDVFRDKTGLKYASRAKLSHTPG
jgi:hypothetical protein